MRRSIPLLTVILVLQLGLAALLAVRRNPLASTTPQTPLIGASIDGVDRMLIEGAPAAGSAPAPASTPASASATTPTQVELAKRNGQWILPGYFNAPADKFKVDDVLSELADLKRGLPIATSATALKRFRLVDDDFERRLTLSEGKRTLSTVYFGSSAGARKTDARTAADRAVYNVDLATYELPTQPADWFAADLLESDPSSLTEMDITLAPGATPRAAAGAAAGAAAASGSVTATASLQLVRRTQPAAAAGPIGASLGHGGSGSGVGTGAGTAGGTVTALTGGTPAAPTPATIWVDPRLPAGRQVDGAHADALARDIAQLRVQAVLGLSARPEWQQDHPLLTLVIRNGKAGSQPVTWTLSQPRTAGATPVKTALRAPASAPTAVPGAAAPGASGPDFYVLKASTQPWYFSVNAATGRQLLGDSAPTTLLTDTRAPGNAPARAASDRRRGARARGPVRASKPAGA